jgi:hypothetical protein
VQGATRSPGAMLLTFSADPQRPRGHRGWNGYPRASGAAAAFTPGRGRPVACVGFNLEANTRATAGSRGGCRTKGLGPGRLVAPIASSRQRRRASFLRSRAHVVPMHRMQRVPAELDFRWSSRAGTSPIWATTSASPAKQYSLSPPPAENAVSHGSVTLVGDSELISVRPRVVIDAPLGHLVPTSEPAKTDKRAAGR